MLGRVAMLLLYAVMAQAATLLSIESWSLNSPDFMVVDDSNREIYAFQEDLWAKVSYDGVTYALTVVEHVSAHSVENAIRHGASIVTHDGASMLGKYYLGNIDFDAAPDESQTLTSNACEHIAESPAGIVAFQDDFTMWRGAFGTPGRNLNQDCGEVAQFSNGVLLHVDASSALQSMDSSDGPLGPLGGGPITQEVEELCISHGGPEEIGWVATNDFFYSVEQDPMALNAPRVGPPQTSHDSSEIQHISAERDLNCLVVTTPTSVAVYKVEIPPPGGMMMPPPDVNISPPDVYTNATHSLGDFDNAYIVRSNGPTVIVAVATDLFVFLVEMQCGGPPPTQAPPTPSPPTPSPPTPAPETVSPPTPSPPTPSPPTPAPPTPSPPTPSPPTPAPLTVAPPTPSPPTPAPPTPAPPTPSPPTPEPTAMPPGVTASPPTPAPPTVAPPTPSPPTPAPPTPSPPTPAPPTPAPPTVAPPTPAPPTPAPATPAPPTPSPPTPSPPTLAPPTPSPPTPSPPTPSPPTLAPPTPSPPTPAPPTPSPPTPSPPTPSPPTPSPATPAPLTPAPQTPSPPTPAPLTPAPLTPAPLTPSPPTPAPLTPAPLTPAPLTPAPLTPAPETPAPLTPAPLTSAPLTPTPQTAAPTAGPTVAPPGETATPTAAPTFAPTPRTVAPPGLTATPTATPTAAPTQTPPAKPTLAPPTTMSPASPSPTTPQSTSPTLAPDTALGAVKPERIPTDTVTHAQERATVVGESAAAVVAVTAVMGVGGGSAAPGNVVVLRSTKCTSTVDDSEDMEVLLHPLQFSISGVPAAGAIVGNIILWVAVVLFFSGLVFALQTCGVGSSVDAPHLSPFMKAGSVVRFPSALLPIPLLLLAGILQSAFDIIFHPRDAVIVNGIGYVGLVTSISFTALMFKTSAKPEATVEFQKRKPLARYLLGEKGWVSNAPLSVERHGLIYDIYRELPWIRGNYFALETLYLYPLTMLSAIRSDDWGICALKSGSMGLIFLLMAVFIVIQDIFLVKFLKHLMVISNLGMFFGLVFYTIAYLNEDMKYWTTGLGIACFMVSMVLALVRSVYDLVTYVMEIKFGYKISKKGHTIDDKECESLCSRAATDDIEDFDFDYTSARKMCSSDSFDASVTQQIGVQDLPPAPLRNTYRKNSNFSSPDNDSVALHSRRGSTFSLQNVPENDSLYTPRVLQSGSQHSSPARSPLKSELGDSSKLMSLSLGRGARKPSGQPLMSGTLKNASIKSIDRASSNFGRFQKGRF